MLIVFLSTASAATLTVAADGSGDYTSIVAAVSAASSGDEISISAGTWAESINTGSKRVTLTGADGAESVILNATGYGSALTAQGRLIVNDITIRNDGGRGLTVSSSAEVDLTGVIFDEVGDTDEYGGAIQISGGSVTLTESTIDGGTAYYGMIHLDNGGSVSVIDSTIKKSEATHGAGIFVSSGSATLEGSTLEQLYSTSSGGAVYLSGGTSLTATDTTFYANLTEDGHGAAIYASYATVETTDSIFDLNYSTNYTSGYYGGAVYLNTSDMTATRTEFTENIAYYGGAIGAYGNSSLTLTDAEFDDNWAYYGGAVYGSSVFTLSDSGSDWVGNESYYYGGAIYAYSQYAMSFEGSEFLENNATYGYGGGVYGYYGTSSYTDVTFEDNYAYYGGSALYAYYTYGSTTLTDCTVTDNTSLYYAGAVYSYAYDSLTISGSTFSYNETEYGDGAGIYSYYNTTTIRDSSFKSNRALDGMGGALYAYYYYGDSPDLVIEDTTFDSNEAYYHGGAVATVYNRYEIRRSNFHVNDTDNAGMGGAIFTQDTHAGLVQQSTFTGNNAAYGGAVYSYDAYSLPSTWQSNTFVENTANIGGAMVVSGSDVTNIINNTFVGNTSVDEGGNLVLVESGVGFVNNAVTHSTAGEGVYIFDEYSRDNSAFSYNAWFEISDGLGGGEIAGGFLMDNGLDSVDPSYASYSPDGNANNDTFVLLADSGLIDAGHPSYTDPDGSVSDIGAWGGSAFTVEDADGDGYDNWLDCDDADASVYPGAEDAWYDGINSDCMSGSDFDADGDGADSDEYDGEDCDDTDASIQTGCDDEVIDTGTEDTGETTEAPVPGDDSTGKDKGCSTAGGAAGMLWLIGGLGVALRRRRA